MSVLYKCGQPVLADSFCAPVFYQGSLHPVPVPIAGAFVPCQPVGEWLYDRGPGNLMATVRFRGATVASLSEVRSAAYLGFQTSWVAESWLVLTPNV